MKKTQDPQEVQQHLEQQDIVKLSAGGRNWYVNSMLQGRDSWVMTISHHDFPHSRVENVTANDKFTIYSPKEYARMVDYLRSK